MLTIPGIDGYGSILLALRRSGAMLNQSLERLATGKRINRASDDPVGAISASQLQAQLAALDAESRGIQRSYANASITDGYLGELSSMMGDLNGLVVAAANTGGLSDAEQQAYQTQIDSLASSMQRMFGDAAKSLGGFALPNDGNKGLADALSAAMTGVSSLVSGGANSVASGNFEAAQAAVNDALNAVAGARGTVGAYQKYDLESRLDFIGVQRESLLGAYSGIMDTDYAEEVSRLNTAEVLNTAGVKLLKLVQQRDRAALDLLR